MRFVTVASEDTPELRYLLNSCEHFGVRMEVVGMGRPYLGNGTKMVYLQQYLKRVSPDEVVLFTDAYDSFFVKPVDDLLSVFQRFDAPLVMTAEDNFYMRITSLKMLLLNLPYKWKYPRSQGRYPAYRYLNSGGFIGYAGYLLELLEQWRIDKTLYSDQQILHQFFVRHPEAIRLDYNHEIFTIYGKFATDEVFEVKNDHLINKQTDSSPYIFHFPGKVHRGLSRFAGQFSFLRSPS